MNLTFKSLAVTVVLGVSMLAASGAQATMTTYTSRTAFEAALSTPVVDSLNGIHMYDMNGTIARNGYTFTTPAMWGCINHGGCGNNASLGFDSAYLWNYSGVDTFTFATAVNGFGFDYGNPAGQGTGHSIIDGVAAVGTAGFYGVIYSDARTSFTVGQTNNFMLMDNITFGTTASQVPEPTMPALLGITLAGLALSRRLRKK